MKRFLTRNWDAVMAALAFIALAVMMAIVSGCSFVSVQVATDKSVVNKQIDPLRREVRIERE